MDLNRKAARYDFVRYQCAKCLHTAVVTAPIRSLTVKCEQCKHPHTIHPEERSDKPHAR